MSIKIIYLEKITAEEKAYPTQNTFTVPVSSVAHESVFIIYFKISNGNQIPWTDALKNPNLIGNEIQQVTVGRKDLVNEWQVNINSRLYWAKMIGI